MEDQVIAPAACALALIAAFGVASLLSRSGFPVPAQGGRIGCIDGLRGFLALFVLCGHGLIWVNVVYGDGLWRGVDVFLFSGLGGLAVPVFFMITGLLFYRRALRGLFAVDWAALYISRVFRIIPLVTVSFLVVSTIVAARFGVAEQARGTYLPTAARWILAIDEPPIFGFRDSGLINAYVLWSLTYEWLFYLLILPAVSVAMVFLSGARLRWGFPVALFAALVAFRHLHGGALAKYTALFVVGMLAHEVAARHDLRALASSRAGSAAGALCLLAAVLLSGDASAPVKAALAGVFFTTVACGCSLGGLLSSRPALILGEVSFSIYVLHGIVLYCAFTGGLTDHLGRELAPLLIPLSSSVVVLVSALSYLLIERRFIEAGKTLSRRHAIDRLRRWNLP